MKSLLVLLFFIFFQAPIYGQKIQFNNETVDTIIVKSNRYVYQFDDKGTTKGEGDIIYYRFDNKKNQYVIHKFYKTKYKSTYRPRKLKLQKHKIKHEIGKIVEIEKIKALLNALKISKTSQTIFEQIDTIKFQKLVTDNKIFEVVKEYKADSTLNEFHSKEEIQKIISDCKTVELLKLYFSEQFKKDGYIVITDYENTLNIWVITNKTKYRFEGKYPNPVKQPWYYHNKITNKIDNILNLDINNSLFSLLPNNFFLKETISDEALFNDYIIWFLKRKYIIRN